MSPYSHRPQWSVFLERFGAFGNAFLDSVGTGLFSGIYAVTRMLITVIGIICIGFLFAKIGDDYQTLIRTCGQEIGGTTGAKRPVVPRRKSPLPENLQLDEAIRSIEKRGVK